MPYRQDYIDKIKQIAGRKWSQSKKCWHLPYRRDSFEQLRALFPELPIILPDQAQARAERDLADPPKAAHNPSGAAGDNRQADQPDDTGRVKLVVTPKKLFVQLRKEPGDIRFIRSLHYARWNPATYLWEVTASEQNLTLLRQYFSGRLTEQTLEPPEGRSLDLGGPRVRARELVVSVAVKQGRLRLLFRYDPTLITFIKTLPYPKYRQENRWWSVADRPVVRADLERFCQDHDWTQRYTKERALPERQPRLSRKDTVNYKSCPAAMADKLRIRRYSASTIQTYTQLFEEFINYYPHLSPEEITEKEIIVFLRYLVEERQVSVSYQNQSINAIKRSTPDFTTNRYCEEEGNSILLSGPPKNGSCRWC